MRRGHKRVRSEYEPTIREELQRIDPSDNRRAPQHKPGPRPAPKAPPRSDAVVRDDLPGLDAIMKKYAADLERGKQLSSRLDKES